MRKIALLILYIISFYSYSQEEIITPIDVKDSISNQDLLNKVVYLDEDWKEIPKGEHKYFRKFSTSEYKYKGKNLININDYYKNGKIQMTGYSTRIDTIDYIGLSTFYEPNGEIYRYTLYEYDDFKDDFPEMDEYASKIKPCDIPNKSLHIKFFPKKLRFIGYRNSDGKRIGVWRFYKKNGKYMVCDFKNGTSPTVIRLYDKNDLLIKKGYYRPDSN